MSVTITASRTAFRARLLLSVAAAWPAFASAQAVLPPIVVIGTREPAPLDREVADVVVIDAARIRASAADSVEDLLRREGGIQLSRNGGPGQNAGLLIRGATSNSTVVLIDGVRVGAASLGQFAFENLSLAQVERIEILRGPGSSLYGADAVGGVVHIHTRRGDAAAPQTSAHIEAGGRSSSTASVSTSGASERFDYALGADQQRSRGVSAVKPGDRFGLYNPDADGHRRSSARAALGLAVAPGHRVGVSVLASRLNAQYDGAEFNPPTFTADPSADFRSRGRTEVAALDYRATLSSAWRSTLQLSTQRDALESGGSTTSRYDTRRQQFTWQNAITLAPGQSVVAAFERINEAVDSTAYAAPQRGNSALVLGYSGRFGAHQVQADVRHDSNSVYGGVDTGKLGWSMRVTPQWVVRAVAGTAFRAPSFNELYFPNYGVPTLSPERARSVEVGANWTGGASAAGATLYRNDVRGLIGYESDPAKCPPGAAYAFGCARNVAQARLQGLTFTASHRAGAFDVRAVLDLLDATDRATGQRLPRRAAHTESVQLGWSQGPWRWNAALVGVGARPEGGTQVAGYGTLDLQARYRLDARWQVEARLLNAGDRRYEPTLDYQAVGRQLFVGLRFDAGAR